MSPNLLLVGSIVLSIVVLIVWLLRKAPRRICRMKQGEIAFVHRKTALRELPSIRFVLVDARCYRRRPVNGKHFIRIRREGNVWVRPKSTSIRYIESETRHFREAQAQPPESSTCLS